MPIDHPSSAAHDSIESHINSIWPHLELILKTLKVPQEIQVQIKKDPYRFCRKKGDSIFAFTRGFDKKPLKLKLHDNNAVTWISYKDPTNAVANFHITFSKNDHICDIQLKFDWQDAGVVVSCNIPYQPETKPHKDAPSTQDEHLLSALTAPEISKEVRAIFHQLLDDYLKSQINTLNAPKITAVAV